MANLHFDVDTTPMADTVNSVKGHVNATTVAVTAMEAAVIATERESSKTICENVDNGFYVMIRSQISQKAVAAYTEMSAKQMTLFQLAKALDGVKKQMEADFNMISRRYTKLFASLNKALETRVKEIDRPAMQLAHIKKTIVFDKLKDNSSMVLSVSNESPFTVQTALGGKLKQKTKQTMHTLANSVIEDQSYNQKVESILEKCDLANIRNKDDSDICFLPVIVLATESFLNKDDYIESVYTAKAPSWQNTTALVSAVTSAKDNFKWTALNDAEREAVKNEFNNFCEKENLDEREAKEIKRLFEESRWETLEESGAI
ncbi:MAG: hypothetical protein LBV52_00840 [Spirochaetaceae bacterium]|jgi:hypothetical protein|nr:hypothetical protein [Spirochaetaceae bacterium]